MSRLSSKSTGRSYHRYRDRRSNDPKYESLLQDAVERVTSGEFRSFRQASKELKVPLSTLTDRAKNRHANQKTASIKRQMLTPEQEEVLLSWTAHRALIGLPYTQADLRNEASAICGKTVGKLWHKKFERRHPELKTARPTKLDPKRAQNFNEAVINDYFDKLEELNARFPGGIPPEHIWNMDEKGIQMGGGRKKSSKKYYYMRAQRHKYRISSDNLELVTILECISAAGKVVPPSFCLQNGSKPDLRELNDDEWGGIYFSDSGWTDSYNCEQWLNNIFIPFAKKNRVDPSKPIVLTMDGHGTHEKPELQRVIYKYLDDEDLEIILFCFPSKCTHKCQPLDVVVFSSVERKWQDVCDACVTKKVPINRFTIIPEYIRGTRDALAPEFIAKAFETTGIYPVRRTVFRKEDFAPSKVSSSQVHVPDDFPQEFPSSDPIEADAESERQHESSDDSSDSDFEADASDSSDDASTNNDIFEPQDDIILSDDGDTASDEDIPTVVAANNCISGIFAILASIETSVIHMTRSSTAKLDLFTAAPPKCVSVEEDMKKTPSQLFNEVRLLRKQQFALYQAFGRSIGQLSGSNAHCTSIHRELESVRVELENATRKKQPRSSTKIKARFLTSKEMREEFDREDAERLENAKVAAEKEKEKEADNAQRSLRVASDALNRVFSGRLASYKKDDLRALALALPVSDKGTNSELLSRIHEFFETHQDIKRNSRFCGLFQAARRRNHLQVVDEDVDDGDKDQPAFVDQGQDYSHAPALLPSAPSVPSQQNFTQPQHLPYTFPNTNIYYNAYYGQQSYPDNHYPVAGMSTTPTTHDTNLQINFYNPY